MIDQRRAIFEFEDRLARIKRGEVLGHDRPGPYTAEERAQEIARTEALIAGLLE